MEQCGYCVAFGAENHSRGLFISNVCYCPSHLTTDAGLVEILKNTLKCSFQLLLYFFINFLLLNKHIRTAKNETHKTNIQCSHYSCSCWAQHTICPQHVQSQFVSYTSHGRTHNNASLILQLLELNSTRLMNRRLFVWINRHRMVIYNSLQRMDTCKQSRGQQTWTRTSAATHSLAGRQCR